MLEMRRLQALHAVVTTGSVKDAAALLGYTPSAISQHITTLEAETKTVLLEPAGRGVRPTAAGRLLAGHAADLLDRMAQTETALNALNAGELGILRLASFATAGAELIPPALASLRQAMPSLEIGLRVADREEAMSMLRNGLVDVAVIEAHSVAAENDNVLTEYPLLTDPFRIVVPRDHSLASRRVIALGDAAEESWISIRCEVGCCQVATSAAFQHAGFTPKRTVEADEYWPAQGFVAAGLGLALIPTLALGVQHPGVAVRRVHRATQPERQVLALTRTAISNTGPVRRMIAALEAEATIQRSRH
ncbi:MAG: LysR substrate-binding domain-containing protein [Nakamurella sp.]